MSRFNKIVKEALGATNLTKIQIKTDPAQDLEGLESMRQAKSYTGYLLEEDPMNPMVISVSDLMDGMPVGGMDIQEDPVEEVKHEGVLYLMQKGLINREDTGKIAEIIS